MRLELVAADGVRLVGHRLPGPPTASATVVIAHGFGGAAREQTVLALGEVLQRVGHDVLTYDSRGHGESDGEATLGDRERLDVSAAVDAVRDGDRPVVLVGTSMGAIGVLRYAAEVTTPVAGVVTVSCPARWRLPRNPRGVLAALMTQTPPGRWFAREYLHVRIAAGFSRPEPPIDLAPRLRAPYAVIHGLADPFISPQDADDLYAATRDPKRLDLVVGLGHGYQPAATAAILDAVEWALTR